MATEPQLWGDRWGHPGAAPRWPRSSGSEPWTQRPRSGDPGVPLRWPPSSGSEPRTRRPGSASEVARELRLRATDTVGTPTGGHGSTRMDLGRLGGSWMDLGRLGITWMDLARTPGLCGDVLDGSGTSWTDPAAPGDLRGWALEPLDGPGSPWMDLLRGPGLHRNILGGPRTSWMDLGELTAEPGTSGMDPRPPGGSPGWIWGFPPWTGGTWGWTQEHQDGPGTSGGSPGCTFCGVQVSMGTPWMDPGPPG